jgi:hypothetical protein
MLGLDSMMRFTGRIDMSLPFPLAIDAPSLLRPMRVMWDAARLSSSTTGRRRCCIALHA